MFEFVAAVCHVWTGLAVLHLFQDPGYPARGAAQQGLVSCEVVVGNLELYAGAVLPGRA